MFAAFNVLFVLVCAGAAASVAVPLVRLARLKRRIRSAYVRLPDDPAVLDFARLSLCRYGTVSRANGRFFAKRLAVLADKIAPAAELSGPDALALVRLALLCGNLFAYYFTMRAGEIFKSSDLQDGAPIGLGAVPYGAQMYWNLDFCLPQPDGSPRTLKPAEAYALANAFLGSGMRLSFDGPAKVGLIVSAAN